METGWEITPVMEAAVLSWLDHYWGNLEEFQVMLLNLDSKSSGLQNSREAGDEHFFPHQAVPKTPTALYHLLQNAPSLCRALLWRGFILMLKGKGPSRPFSEVSCCYGCICLLNIMMVL